MTEAEALELKIWLELKCSVTGAVEYKIVVE